jgi:hypothetical protein
MSKEYIPPQTRIQVVKSSVQTDYWSQRKNWLGFWESYSSLSWCVLHALDIELGSIEYAKKVIDLHHEAAKRTWEDNRLIKKHKEEQKTTYFKYP